MVIPWLINPLLNPWLSRLMLPLCGLFLLIGLGLFVVQWTHGMTAMGQLTDIQAVLWQRYRTWLLIAFFYVGAILSGPLILALLCAFLCWQGAYEYGMLTSLTVRSILLLAFSGLLTLLSVLLFGPVTLAVAPIVAFFVWSLLAILTLESGLSLEKAFSLATLGFWGYLYVGWLPAHLLALLASKFPGLVVLVGLGVALSDVGAFCLGKLLGGPKLAPLLSPGKTWSGTLGNLFGAGGAVFLTRFLLPALPFWQDVLLTLTIGIGSVWGDLLESLLKRRRGVKDAGTLLPGFGGLLDRIDSLLLVAPLVYYLSCLFAS